jgi:hypothetical protein
MKKLIRKLVLLFFLFVAAWGYRILKNNQKEKEGKHFYCDLAANTPRPCEFGLV